jgi:tetratricopeptide (TPR) repeat protein
MALALRGDVQRRSGHHAEAASSYREALTASPLHARASFGLAKLALSGQAEPTEAREALGRLLDDREGTPRNERARAALYLAALQARSGDRAGASATIDRAGLDPAARSWLEKAAGELELQRGAYRPVGGAPAPLLSASDDDPYVPPSPRAERPAAQKAASSAAAKRKATALAKKKAPAAKGKAKAKPRVKPKPKAKPKPEAKPKPKPKVRPKPAAG